MRTPMNRLSAIRFRSSIPTKGSRMASLSRPPLPHAAVSLASVPLSTVALAVQAAAVVLAAAPVAASAQVLPQDPLHYSRTTAFEYYTAADGAKAGLLKAQRREPAQPQLCVSTRYGYDAFGNAVSTLTANCTDAAGGTTAQGDALFTARASTATFAAQTITVGGVALQVPAGSFATAQSNTRWDELGRAEARVYDPRFGVVVGATSANQTGTSSEVDDFGRVTREHRPDGTLQATQYCTLTGLGIDTSANSPDCPLPATAERPADAVRFVHTETRNDGSGARIGAFRRSFFDRAGRLLRTVTQAFDGDTQFGGAGRLVAQDTDYSPLGQQTLVTQPYFLDTGSTSSGGTGGYGMTRTEWDALGRPVRVYTRDDRGQQAKGG